MALIRIDHTPETVQVNLPLYVIVPDPGKMLTMPVRNRKVLYLLHGLSEDASAWQRYSSIESIADCLWVGGGYAICGTQFLHRSAQRSALFHLPDRRTAALPGKCVWAGSRTVKTR
jgi:hypothetical protein